MTKQEKIQTLKETILWKPDIPLALDKLDCKIGIEVGVRTAGNLSVLAKNPKFKKGMLFGLDCWTEDPDNPEIQSETFKRGYVAIYMQDLKFPPDSKGPFQLVYMPPSFEKNEPGPLSGPIIYKINKEYNPNQ